MRRQVVVAGAAIVGTIRRMRTILTLLLCGFLAVLAFTVKLGERTFVGHVRAIWATDEAQSMRKGVGETAGPAFDRVKRGVEAGLKAAAGDDAGARDAGVEDAAGVDRP
jgi:hypothetical protein